MSGSADELADVDKCVSVLDVVRAAHAEGRVLHDPRPAENRCPECDEAWPCEVRKRQHPVLRQMVDYLRSSLYKRTELLDSDPEGIRLTSPLGWSVWLTYGVASVVVTIRDPAGLPYASTTSGDLDWLGAHLP